MFCTQCGRKLNENQKFCTNCGLSIELAASSTSASRTNISAPSPITAERRPASRSSSATAEVPAAVATSEVPGPIPVTPLDPPDVRVGPGKSGYVSAPRKAISPLLMWGGIGGLALVAAVAVILFLRSSGQQGAVPDTEIEKSIQAKFAADSDLGKCTIEVRSQKGVVTLTGLVNSSAERSTASRIVLEQPAVKTVVDNLVLATIPQLPAAEESQVNVETNSATSSHTVATIVVRGNRGWTPTGVFLNTGATDTVSASGGVSMGRGWPLMSPAGKSPNCGGRGGFPGGELPCWSLIGRVGDGAIFYVGNKLAFRAPEAGQLFLGVNDDRLGDNSGAWTAIVTAPAAVSDVPSTPPRTQEDAKPARRSPPVSASPPPKAPGGIQITSVGPTARRRGKQS